MPSTVLLLRHAQSEWNAIGLWQGQADPPLSAEGRRQATVAATRIAREQWFDGFDLVASSDLARARQTAELLIDALGVMRVPLLDEGLREFDAGEWSGHTLPEIEERWPGEVDRFTHGLLDSPPAGENRHAFDLRVAAATARIAELSAQGGARSVLMVAHGGVVGSIARSAGLARRHIGHLAGYLGQITEGGLFPEEPVDLLEAPELVVDTAK
ncbi:MAG TPA: histidine phosphatase family protein [Acidimicrobiales bacterium]|nr:histidine phosphatase family protein [Acidimicrobiales bacterium]